MRSALLILVLLWSCLGAIPMRGAFAAEGDERVCSTVVGDDEVVVPRLRTAELIRSLEARRPQPAPFGPRHLLPPLSPLHTARVAATIVAQSRVAADAARVLFVQAQPIAPRAPPPART